MSEVWTQGAGYGAGRGRPVVGTLCVGDTVLETVRRGGDGRWLFAPEHAARASRRGAPASAAPRLAERLQGAFEALDAAPESWSAMRLFVTPDASGSPRIWASQIAWQPPAERTTCAARCVQARSAPGPRRAGEDGELPLARRPA